METHFLLGWIKIFSGKKKSALELFVTLDMSMTTINSYSCKCGQTDPLEFYKYRTYQCRNCTRAAVSAGSPKPPSCKCGATDPHLFYKRSRSKCKACIAAHNKTKYDENMADASKRREKIKYNLAYQKKHVFRYRVAAARRRATEKGLSFSVTEEYIRTLHERQKGKCFYSGIAFDDSAKHYTWSIDRIDSSKGYTEDNVVLATSIVNTMKNNLSVDEFMTVVRAVVHQSGLPAYEL